jgi:hypothetical protein
VGNYIEPAGAKHISEALKVNKTLTSLKLSRIRIKVEFANFKAEGAEHLSDMLKNNSTLLLLNLSIKHKED